MDDAALAAVLLAIDPVGCGGVCLRMPADARRAAWLEHLAALVGPQVPLRRLPAGTGHERLIGTLDLAATVQAGRTVTHPGQLASADGGFLVIAMAERLPVGDAAIVAMAMDRGEVGIPGSHALGPVPTEFGVVLLDEGAVSDEEPPPLLLDRLAFRIERWSGIPPLPVTRAQMARIRALASVVDISEAAVRALTGAAMAMGIVSLRAPALACRVARLHAAWSGRFAVTDTDLVAAARLVLAPRAQCLPQPPDQVTEVLPDNPPDAPQSEDAGDEARHADLQEVVLAAARTALPSGLLSALATDPANGGGRSGGSGREQIGTRRGRPIGMRRGLPVRHARLHLIATLQAALPWQKARRARGVPQKERRLRILPEDFRIVRVRERQETLAIVVVDASGSSASYRLAEAKGAVELLLADCYTRRDHVALIAFRGSEAPVILPPTRSLARARRALSGLPGGGATPIAAALQAAGGLAEGAARRGQTPLVVVLTDGRANVDLAGRLDRRTAQFDCLAAARSMRACGWPGLVIDTSPRPGGAAHDLARAMGADYLPMPQVDGRAVSAAVQQRLRKSVN